MVGFNCLIHTTVLLLPHLELKKGTMMRTLLYIGILVSLFQPLFAQNSTIAWGPEYERDNGIIDLIGSDDTQFYAISGPSDKPTLLAYNFSCKQVSEKPIDLSVNDSKSMAFYRTIHTADHDYLIFLDRDKKQDKSSFYYAEVKNGALTPLTKSFHSFPFSYTYGKGLGPAVAYDEEATSGSFRISPDKKTIVTFGSDIGHYADQIIEVVVFNENLEQAWKKSHTIPVPNRQVEVLELAVSNSGEVYVIVQKWEKLNDRYMGDKPLDYILYAFTASGVKEYKLKLDQNRQPVAISLQIGKQGEIAVMGTYRTLDQKMDYSLGTFFARINEAGTLVSKTYPYTAELLTAMNHIDLEAKNKALSAVDIVDHGTLANGHFYFTALKNTFYLSSSATSFAVTIVGQMLVSFDAKGASIKIDYMQQPLHLKNVSHPGDFYSYQKDNGVVFVSNYVKVALDDKVFKKAPIYTSICTIEPGEQKKCVDIDSSPNNDNLVCPRYQLKLKNGKNIVMRANGFYGKVFSFGIY